MKRKKATAGSGPRRPRAKADCRVLDRDLLFERLGLLAGSAARVVDYWQRDESLQDCAGVEGRRAEMAFAAEGEVRSALKLALDSVNDLIDEGAFHSTIGDVRALAAKQKIDVERMIGGARDYLQQKMGADLGVFDQAIDAFRRADLSFGAHKDGLRVSFRTDDQRRHQIILPTSARPGDSARVTANEFFGHVPGRVVLQPVPVPIDEDCHHSPQLTIVGKPTHVDAYGSIIGMMALAKEAIYRHARTVDEVGPAAIRGAGIGIAIIILIIVAIVLIAAGGAIVLMCKDGELEGGICTFGKVLMVAGVAGLLIAGCSIGWCAGPQGIYFVVAMAAIMGGITQMDTSKG